MSELRTTMSIPTEGTRSGVSLRNLAALAALAYLCIAGAWIALSDRVLGAFVTDPELLIRLGTYKGLAFVVGTSALLYLLLRQTLHRIERAVWLVEDKETERLRLLAERRHAESAEGLATLHAEREQSFATALVEATPGILYLYDQSGRFLRWNKNFERVSGYSEQEIASMSPLDFFAVGDKKAVRERIAEVFERGEASVEASFVTKGGAQIPYFFTGRRIAFSGHTCLIGVGIDASEQKAVEEQLRRTQERYRTTLDSILEGCQIVDFDWRYLYLNEAAEAQNRRPASEMLGHRLLDMWPGIEATAVFRLLDVCMRKRVPQHEEIEFVFPDGSSGWFDVRAQPVPEGIFLLSIDITERHRAEIELHQLNQELEQKVSERTAQLAEARERAEAADRTKSAFLATMSHELRTPLNSILGFTGIVLAGMAGPLNSEQEKQLGMVQRSARHLLDLINDVLDISKIEAGQLEVRSAPFDLGESVSRVVESVQQFAAKKNIALETTLCPVPEGFASDRRRVEQILLNLLNNAIKFTDQGTVRLTVDVTSPSSSASTGGSAPERFLRFRVEDSGIGIKTEELDVLFQPFRQIDSGLQRQHEGTGLGLAICRRLAELLGGSIHAESQWNRGSTFSVLLPLSTKDT